MAGWSFLAFIRKRVIRLYPMLLVGGAAGCVVLAVRHLKFGDISWSNIALVAIPNLLLAPSPALLSFRPVGFLLDSPFWSLSCELVFNAVYAVIAILLTTRILIGLLFISGAALFALSIVCVGVNVGMYWNDYDLGLLRAAFPFLAGVAIHRLLAPGVASEALNLPIMAILALLLMSPIALPGQYEAAVVIFVFPILLIAGTRSAPSGAWVPICRKLGDISYPLYAVHYPIVTGVAQASKIAHLSGAAQLCLGLLCAAISLIIAYAALILFDRPLRAWLDHAVPRVPGDLVASPT